MLVRKKAEEKVCVHPPVSVRGGFQDTHTLNNKIHDAQISYTKQYQFLVESMHTLLCVLSHLWVMNKNLEYC